MSYLEKGTKVEPLPQTLAKFRQPESRRKAKIQEQEAQNKNVNKQKGFLEIGGKSLVRD